MESQDIRLRTTYRAVLSDAKKDARRTSSNKARRDYVKIADEFRRGGKAAWAFNILSPLKRRYLRDPYFNFVFALVCRDVQDMEGAYAHASAAANLAPEHPDILFAAAQFAFETWRPAQELFEQAQQLAPEDLSLKKNLALACASEGQADRAIRILETALQSHSDWLEGHQQLVSIKVMTGDADPFDSLASSCQSEPGDLKRQLVWFYLLAQAKEWDDAGKVLHGLPENLRNEKPFLLSSAYYRAETGGELTEDELTGTLSQLKDPGFDVCRTRYLLRTGQPERAMEVAAEHMRGVNSRLFWPYLALCWRLTSDPRAYWLEAGGDFVSVVDLNLKPDFLSELACVLRGLHTYEKPYLEQSVRGGTQTNRNLFFNPDPHIQTVRRAATEAVGDYKSDLTFRDDDHPLLSNVPEQTRFSGAWSVALAEQGYHSIHTHVLGWLSSALYISLPSKEDLGAFPAGQLSVGDAPPELGLDLEAYKVVEPKAGQLVLFPSYTWHGTTPFESGERLTIAFDVSVN